METSSQELTILHKDQYTMIYRFSHILVGTCMYGIYRQHYYLAVCPGFIYLTSINYWRKPDYSWRRYLDMAVVKSTIIYQHIMAYNAEYAIPYYTIFGLGIFMYPIGIYYYSTNDYWKSTYSHILLHVLANIGTIILYSGKIQ
jgi:hypothetical protein